MGLSSSGEMKNRVIAVVDVIEKPKARRLAANQREYRELGKGHGENEGQGTAHRH